MKTLEELTDQELSEAFAVECVGYVLFDKPMEPPMSRLEVPEKWCYRDRSGNFYIGEPYAVHPETTKEIGVTFGYMWHRPKFAADANAVLPFVQAHDIVCHFVPDNGLWHLRTYSASPMLFSEAKILARAACLILIKSQRAATAPTA